MTPLGANFQGYLETEKPRSPDQTSGTSCAQSVGGASVDDYELILIIQAMETKPRPARPLRWVGSARKDYLGFPEKLRAEFGCQQHLAQVGLHPPSAKLLKGLGSGTVELVDNFDGDTFRAIYTVRLETAVYVLHAFKKKSKQGIKTPQADIDLIRRRLRDAEVDDAAARRQENE